MQEKLVSVFINAYNAEKYILKTIESVINQTYKNLQIIVVDDCSTDSTYDLIKSVNDDRIEVYKTPFNAHISSACNEALKHIKGEYIAHLDADDLWAPEKIEKQVAFLEENTEYGACFTHAEIIDENGNIADESQDYLRSIYSLKNSSHTELYRFFYDNANRLCHSAMLVRTCHIKQIGLHDASLQYLHDFDYWMRLITVSHIYIYPEKLTLVRRHGDNSSEMNDEKWKAHDTEFARIIYKSINLCPDDLFLGAFKDKLKLTGEHTHEETELEKAFLLLEGPLVYKENPVLGLYKFSKLFEDEKYIKLAKEKFNFTTRDFYKIQTNQAYFNPAKNQELVSSLDFYTKKAEHFENTCSNLNNEVSELKTKISDQSNYIRELASQVDAYKNSFLEIQNSFFWRLTAPARRFVQFLKHFLSRHKKLLIVAIFVKGFLRGGISLGFERASAYKNYIIESKHTKFGITKQIFDEQNSYKFPKDIKFSILVPLYNTPKNFFKEMVESVQNQTYGNWELCLADGSDSKHSYLQKMCLKASKTDKRIIYKKLTGNKGISENTNECINMATGDYIALFDHDDLLHPSALFEYMKVICEQDADFIYCDEDKFKKFGGETFDPNFKPDFSVDTLRSYNYICHFTVFKKSLLDNVGVFRKEFDGSQDHDLILRLTEQAKNIVHIPKILYHWRISSASVASDPYAKPYTIEAGKKAVSEHLNRSGLKGTVESAPVHPNVYRIKYDIIGNPLVSIIIPNYNHVEDLSRCINSIIEKSTYNNYEIIIVENNSDQKTFDYYDTLKKYTNIKVVVYKPDKAGFNYSAINNFGVKFASGEHYLLLNNDIEVITPNWIEEMLMFSQRSDTGAVGAKLYYPNNTIQHAGVIVGLGGVAGHSHKHHLREHAGYMMRTCLVQNLSACTAACLLIRKDVFEQVGGLDESFAVAFNDIDLCMRIREAGYLITFTPFAELYHYESISRGLEDTIEKQARFASEVNRFKQRWAKQLDAGDPYYNPNLTLDREDFSLK